MSHEREHRAVERSTVTPSFYYFFSSFDLLQQCTNVVGKSLAGSFTRKSP